MIGKITLSCIFMLWFANAQAILLNTPSSYIVTANLDLYDTNGDLITSVAEDGWSLFTSGAVTFSDSSLISDFIVHDFSVISNLNSVSVVGMLLDWGLSTNVYNEEVWNLAIGDDFINGIAYYYYYSIDTDLDGVPGAQLKRTSYLGGPSVYSFGVQYLESGMTANFTLSMASGAYVPVPPSIWLFGIGTVAILGVFRKRKA